MGRHRSTLKELGLGANNSPNPWKHGSAKRVVRALDYGTAEPPPPKPIPQAPPPPPSAPPQAQAQQQPPPPPPPVCTASDIAAELAAAKQAHAVNSKKLADSDAALRRAEADIAAERETIRARTAALDVREATIKERELKLAKAEAAVHAKAAELEAALSAATAPTVAAAAKPKPPVNVAAEVDSVKPAATAAVVAAHPTELPTGNTTADWARGEVLAATLNEQSANPDEVFYPLHEQKSCKLSDIFSGGCPVRVRDPLSGAWTPSSAEGASTAALPAASEAAAGTAAPGRGRFQLVGAVGVYAGEVTQLPPELSKNGVAVLGRSSSCDVTLTNDDQVSRRHLQIEARDGKLWVRDLDSTYGTKVNGNLVSTEAQVRPGDTLSFGASTFRLQCATC